MKKMPIWILLALACCPSGCSMATNITRNLCNEPRQFLSDLAEARENHATAHKAWNDFQVKKSTPDSRADFAAGFHDGYVSVLKNEKYYPWPMPPAKYWQSCSKSSNGRQTLEEWYRGYREGAQQAQDSGGGQRRKLNLPMASELRRSQPEVEWLAPNPTPKALENDPTPPVRAVFGVPDAAEQGLTLSWNSEATESPRTRNR